MHHPSCQFRSSAPRDAVDVRAFLESSRDAESLDEQMGSKEKFWFDFTPSPKAPSEKWLFKFCRDSGNFVRGEDWSESLTHVTAGLIHVQTPCTALARCDSRRGIMVRSFLKEDESLVHGNELLSRATRSYDMNKGRKNPGYTLENIYASLDGYAGPDGFTAFDGIAGFFVLDALVSGRDRHHENWGIVTSRHFKGRLAPSFDHGNSLAFSEPEDRAKELVSDSVRLAAWIDKGKSHHFPGKPRLVGIAGSALNMCTERARSHFIGSLEKLDLSEIEAAMEMIPKGVMSTVYRELVIKIIERNKEKLFDEFVQYRW